MTPTMPGLALTFDDGPDPVWTPRLLDALTALGARATFFPIARRAAAMPHLVARMLREGHTVGLHCDEHVRHSARGPDWLRADTRRALARLRRVGLVPSLWRVPWGAAAPWTAEVASENALALVGWSVDSHDWRGDRAQAMFTAARPDLRPGAIVLAHDGIGPGARRTGAAQTVALSRLIAGHARATGVALRAL